MGSVMGVSGVAWAMMLSGSEIGVGNGVSVVCSTLGIVGISAGREGVLVGFALAKFCARGVGCCVGAFVVVGCGVMAHLLFFTTFAMGVDVGVVLSRSIVAVKATRAVKQAATLHAMRRRFLSLVVFRPGFRPFSINKS